MFRFDKSVCTIFALFAAMSVVYLLNYQTFHLHDQSAIFFSSLAVGIVLVVCGWIPEHHGR